MMNRLLVHSGKHPFQPFDYSVTAVQAMRIFGNNSGNLLFTDAVFKYLYTSPDRELVSDGYRFATDDPQFSVEAVNDQYDGMILPAANWLAPHYRELLPVLAAKIRRLRIPCVVIGLGVQANTRENFDCLDGFAPEAKEFLSAVADRSHSISVRGAYTAACLQRLGFTQVNVTGCPSFYRNLSEFSVEKPAVDRHQFTFAVNGSLQTLAKLKADLFDSPRSVLFSQAGPLRALALKWRMPWSELKRWLGDGFSLNLIADGRVRCFGDIAPWIEALKQFHFSIGTRIHGSIIALLAGVPASIVAHDSRTAEMAEFYRIPTRHLQDVENGFDVYEEFERADYTAMHAEYPAKLANLARFFEDNQLDHTLFERNGHTYYDVKTRSVPFSPDSFNFDDSFFKWVHRLAPAFTGLKTLKHRLNASAA